MLETDEELMHLSEPIARTCLGSGPEVEDIIQKEKFTEEEAPVVLQHYENAIREALLRQVHYSKESTMGLSDSPPGCLRPSRKNLLSWLGSICR